jgi:uncharacterized FlaG/YvyC family protein
MSDTSPISEVVVRSPIQVTKDAAVTVQAREPAQSSSRNAVETDVSAETLKSAVQQVESIVNSVVDTSLSFSIDEELSRMVVAVKAVGSDEIIRQFPPEEFITVAKFIASQEPTAMSDDFLKGILFDQYT